MSRLFAIVAVSAMLGATCASAEKADARKVAQEACAACHDIGTGSAAGAKSGPSFVEIARMPSTTELSLKVFLRSSHRNMPNLMLSADEIDALAAYILELAGKGGA